MTKRNPPLRRFEDLQIADKTTTKPWPWLDWQPISTFPRDGESYLVWDDRRRGGPQVVFWDDTPGMWKLQVEDGPTYRVEAFTHWARIPGPLLDDISSDE